MFQLNNTEARPDADGGTALEHCIGLPLAAQDERVLLVTDNGLVVYTDWMESITPHKSHPLAIQSWLRACGYG